MTIVLALTAWILLLFVVAGLCAAARLGDLQQSASAAREGMDPSRWDSGEPRAIATGAHGRHGRAGEASAPFAHAGNAAA